MDQLPRVTLPSDWCHRPIMLSFAPCSNLCLYMFGAAACLQRASNFSAVQNQFRYHGISSGALVAAVLAVNADVPALFEKCMGLLDDLNIRRWGWIGAYSRTIRAIVQQAVRDRDVSEAFAPGKVRIGTTAFTPLPSLHEITSCETGTVLEQAILASCYIPVVWEDAIWLPDIGPCLDGGASGFLVDGDVVFGPYHSNHPDVGPAEEYPRQLVFQPVDARDMLRLFEDGYRDCARWIQAGCPSRQAERHRLLTEQSCGGALTMLREGLATFLEVTGVRKKPRS